MIIKKKSNKYYFFLKFRLIFLNFKYLTFIKINLQEYKNFLNIFKKLKFNFLKLKFNFLNGLFINKYINNIIKNNYFLLYFNDYNKNIKFLTVDGFSFSGYFLNFNYINKLNTLYNYYVNNYYIYISIINKYINIFIFYIYLYMLKLITLFLKQGLKKILN